MAAVVLRPFQAVGSWYLRQAQSHPFPTAFFTSGIKTGAADLFAQTVVEKKDLSEIDWTRNISFTAFGFAYLGGVQYYLYNVKFVQWCGGITAQVGHVGVAPLKTLMDQGIHHPFIYFPSFFLCKGLVERQPRPLEWTWHKWNNEIWDSCKALWMIWVPAQVVNFAFVPRYLRVPFAAAVSFVWCVVLSTMQGAPDSAKAADEPQHALSCPREEPMRLLPRLVASRCTPAAAAAAAAGPRSLAAPCRGGVAPSMRSLLPAHSAACPLLC